MCVCLFVHSFVCLFVDAVAVDIAGVVLAVVVAAFIVAAVTFVVAVVLVVRDRQNRRPCRMLIAYHFYALTC